MITLRQVEAFRAVMISGSVTQAANMLFVSQPAVSRILSDLEYRVGFKLFDRTRRHLVPTEEGRAFYDEVERAFTGLQQIDQAAASIRRYHRGHLRLITFQSLAPTLMVDLITRFAERYPEIAVSLEVQPSQRVFERVVSQHCDLGILTAPITGASVVASTIATTNAVCILPKSHPLATKPMIRPGDLAGQPCISFMSDSTFRHQVDAVFNAAGVTRDMKLEVRSADGVPAAWSAALPAFWAGILYDEGALRAAGELVLPFGYEAWNATREQVASVGMAATVAGKPLRDVATAVLAIAHEALARRAHNDAQGRDERQYLEPLMELAAQGKCIGDAVLGDWSPDAPDARAKMFERAK